jgi:DNA helicase HerA-like ATPase
MDNSKIGRISATEKAPTSCDEFMFWLDDKERVSPFDIVKVENNIGDFKSVTYGVIQDIFHITDSPGHLSNYISSDFGKIEVNEQTLKLGLSYAKAAVIHNDKNNLMPVRDGSVVYIANEEDIKKALDLDFIDRHNPICAGIYKTSYGVSVPISYSGGFLVGPESAHMNISGISGLATKTSYAMFLLQSIHQKIDDVASIILNVKGDDLLRLELRNPRITEEQRADWAKTGLECQPFKDVKYFYPYKKAREFPYSNTSLDNGDLKYQFDENRAFNFAYTYEHDKGKLDLLFSNIDDPNFTIDSILNYIAEHKEFESLTWDTFKGKLKDFTQSGKTSSPQKGDIPTQSWRKFSRLIANSIGNDIFQSSTSGDARKMQVFLSQKIANIKSGETFVVDIAKLDEQLQCLVFGDIIQTIYELKHGDIERKISDPIPKKIIIFVDELNKYAPDTSSKHSPILANLLEITERGRYEGVILFSAEQFKSAIHDRIKGNCSTHAYGRTNAIEISKPDYRYIPKVFQNMMTRLGQGDLIIEHPVFKTLLKIQFPYPSYQQGKKED